MIQLHFKVDLRYLVYYVLVNCGSSRFIDGAATEHIVAFQNLVWKKLGNDWVYLRTTYGANSKGD